MERDTSHVTLVDHTRKMMLTARIRLLLQISPSPRLLRIESAFKHVDTAKMLTWTVFIGRLAVHNEHQGGSRMDSTSNTKSS